MLIAVCIHEMGDENDILVLATLWHPKAKVNIHQVSVAIKLEKPLQRRLNLSLRHYGRKDRLNTRIIGGIHRTNRTS